MKGTENFKAVIQKHLNELAEKDPLFSETLKKENKNIDDCITYILNTVQKSGYQNEPREYNKKIVSLVKKNLPKIREIAFQKIA